MVQIVVGGDRLRARGRWLASGIVLVLLAACGAREPSVLTAVGETMGTTYKVRAVVDDEREFGAALVRVEALLEEVNGRFSTYRPDSAISRLNAHRSTEPFDVDEEFAAVLRLGLELAERSGGAYDPTVLPLVRVLDFGPGADEQPATADEIEAARAHVDYRNVEILEGPRVRKRDPELEIDLSSIAKGAGVDRVSELLIDLGLDAHMVEIGGEVVCRGEKPGGEPWRIAVERPPSRGAELATRQAYEVVELRDRALATSGSYRNFRESGGVRLHHALDARTGANAPNGVVSVSVEAPSCALADGLATALMVLGPEAGGPLVESYAERDVRVLFLVADESEPEQVREVRLHWPKAR